MVLTIAVSEYGGLLFIEAWLMFFVFLFFYFAKIVRVWPNYFAQPKWLCGGDVSVESSSCLWENKSFVGIEARECSYTSVHCSPACVTCLSVYNVMCVSVCAPIFGSYKLIRVWDLRLTEWTTAPPLRLWRKKTLKPPQLQRSWKAWISFRVMLTVPLRAVSFFSASVDYLIEYNIRGTARF